jgi:F-type H+-transporting ATPase subunit gamma
VRRALQVGAEHGTQGHEVVYLPVGRKGLGTLRFRRREVQESWTGFSDRPEYSDAAAIVNAAAKAYIAGELDLVVLVYNRFVSALAQHVDVVELLPIPEGDLAGMDARERAQEGAMLFEPEAEEMIGELLVSSLEVNVYRALLESTASEHGARMTAMRNASENANDLINAYTLAMNRARQAEITQEILEVVAGADALQ